MARIRSIKPEFPQSESMGRVSRDARLLFVQLWCICDDHGRTRAASRMLASLLFPYDDDAPGLIGGWISELEREGCIRVYEHGGSHFLEIPNWLKHQKIDKPSKPQFPAFGESSRILANPREHSSLEGKGREGKGGEASATVPAALTPEELQKLAAEQLEADRAESLRAEEEAARLAEEAAAKAKAKKHPLTFKGWIESLGEDELAIPENHYVFEHAAKAGLPDEFVDLAWEWFRRKYSSEHKRYSDWRHVFANAVDGAWGGLWRAKPSGGYELSPVGLQFQRRVQSEQLAVAA